MAGFQNFTPRTANLAKVWEGFNPAANFLGGMKAVRQMDLDEAAEARLREAAEVDRMVKETMLPYETELAQAKIGLTLAQRDYAASRASRAADDASTLSVFERLPNDKSTILEALGLDDGSAPAPAIRNGGGGASILDAAPTSRGDFESFSLGASAGSTNNPIIAEFSPKEESGPLYSLPENKTLLASSDSFGVPDTGGQDNLKSLTAATALTPKEGPRNAADWDEDPTNFSPLEKKNPLTSLEIPEDKRKEIQVLNDQTGALNKSQPAPTSEEDMGTYLVKGLNKLEKARDRAQLAKSGPEKRLVSGLALKLEELTYRDAAQKLGVDPDMGELVVKTLTRSGVNGMKRSPSQINQIVDLMKDGMGITEASAFFDAKARKDLEDKLNGKAISDPLKQQQDLRSQRISLTEAISKDNLDDGDKKMFRAEINRIDRQLNSLVSPEERAYEFNQSNIGALNLVAGGRFDDTTKNWKGEVITKDSEDKTTSAIKFTEEVLVGNIPSLTVTQNEDGSFDLPDLKEIEPYFNNRGVPLQESFGAGVYIKNKNGVTASPLPAKITYFKDGKAKINWVVDPTKYIQSTDESVTSKATKAVNPLSSPSDAGLSLRQAVKKGVESVDKAGIAAALGLANIGPGLANISADIYEAGESFATGDTATKLPRYRLYDGGDVEERYNAQKKRSANKIKAGL